MVRKLLLISIIFTGIKAHGQLAKIVDANTKDPIDMVFVYSQKHSVTSDLKGEFNLSQFSKTDTLIFQHPGYKRLKLAVKEVNEADNYVLLTPSIVGINEVVLSENKFETNTEEIPKRVEVVSKEAIRFENPQTAADVLGVSKSVFIQKSQLGGGSPMIRGLSTNRVLLVVDGVRMNNAIFREGNLQNVISLDANSIQQTEVILGPGSVIYGSDALGGVMNFTTLMPTYSASEKTLVTANGLARYSSAAQEKTGHFDFNMGGKKWAWMASGTYSDYGDLKMGSNGPEEYKRPEYVDQINGKDTVLKNEDDRVQKFSGYSQQNYMTKLGYRPNKYWQFTVAGHFSKTSDVPRYDRLTQYRNGSLRYGDWYYGPQQWAMGQFQGKHTQENAIYTAMKFNLAYQDYSESRLSRSFGSTKRKEQYEGVKVFTTNLDFEKEISPAFHFYYGANATFNTVSSRAQFTENGAVVAGDPGTRYPNGSTWNSQGVYVDGSYDLGRGWTADAGMRYTLVQVNATFDQRSPVADPVVENQFGALNGMVGITKKTNNGYRFYGNVSTGFRAPNIDDIGKVFDSEPGQVVVPNPNLKPEYLTGLELGMDKSWNDIVSVQASVFYTYLNDIMVRRPFSINGVDSLLYDGTWSSIDAIQNAESATIYGFSVGASAAFTKNWSATAKYNLQKGETSEGDNLRHVAPSFGSIGVVYTHGWLKAELYSDFNSELSYDKMAPSEVDKDYLYAKDNNGNPYSPSWYTLNVKASFKLNHYLTVMGGVENITDQLYRPYSSGISAPGRNFIISLKATI